MKTIWKFALPCVDEAFVSMPVGAQILCVQTQINNPCLWAVVDPDALTKEVRRFNIYGTGHEIEGEPGTYIGTFQLAGGTLVFHVFEAGS